MLTRTRVRRLVVATAGLTFLLILLGRYTALTGAGLACEAQWPLCSGGTLPQTLPDFVEWFHRLVAMVAGFVILGTAYAVWKTYDARRIRAASALAVVLLPLQVLLGRETVVSFVELVILGHLAVGILIFGSLVATAVWAVELDRTRAETPNPDTTETDGDTGAAGGADDAADAPGRSPTRSDD